MNYWLIKSEPNTYSWDDLVKLGKDHWDGVRNYQARNNLKATKLPPKNIIDPVDKIRMPAPIKNEAKTKI